MHQSRREWLKPFTTPFRAAAEVANNLRSENAVENSVLDWADRVIEYGAEGSVFTMALYIGFETAKDKLYTLQLTPRERMNENANTMEHFDAVSIPLLRGLPESFSSSQLLASQWRDTYYRSKTITYLDTEEECSGVGEDKVCRPVTKIKTKVVWNWEEPDELTRLGLDHDELDRWKGFLHHLGGRFQHLRNSFGSSPDFGENIDSYEFAMLPIDQDTLNVWRGVGYTGSTLVYDFYEEIITFFQRQAEQPYFHDSQEEFSNKRIKRRSFIKFLGGLFAALKVRDFRSNLAQENSLIDEKVHDFGARVIAERNALAPKSVFHWFVGKSPEEIFSYLDMIIAKCQAVRSADNSSTDSWAEVEPLITQLQFQATEYRTHLSELLIQDPVQGYILPEALVFGMRNVGLHDEIQGAVLRENTIANETVIKEISFFAATLAGFAGGAEAFALASDAFIDKLRHNSDTR